MKYPFPLHDFRGKPRGAEEDEDEEDEDMFNAFHVSMTEGAVEVPLENGKTTQMSIKLVNIFVFGPIVRADQFIPAIKAMQLLSDSDHICVHLCTPGGSVYATDTFLHALDNCAATNTFVATGGCHSAGSLMLMHADEVSFSENFCSLVHNGSTGFGGKFSDIKRAAKFSLAWDEALMRRAYKDFMTEDEITRMIDGEDFWFDATEFEARLQKRNEIEDQDEE